MKSFGKCGLAAGIAAMLINIPVCVLMGLCGPLITLAAGFFAGFLGARLGEGQPRAEAARSGAVGGALAGGIALIGQVLGSMSILTLARSLQLELPIGAVPAPGAPEEELVGYYTGGLGAALCFGVVGIALAAAAGGLGAALGVRQEPALPPLPVPAVSELQQLAVQEPSLPG